MGITSKGQPSGLATLNASGQLPASQVALQGSATLDFPSISAGTVATLTITVAGAAAGDRVAVGAPTTVNASLMWCAHVSAANTVTIRLYNPTGGSIDPSSATWKVSVFQ
ncbi:hypothetical protein JOL79_11325 [Microbispora sp. RL4-1S]|uniref:Uncharacterized protein n=1 Tax=Microbispora oryzae TaxID=2806554 RepID=A0A940WF01_9ACTN|nr:hypothetical protein [Microbispora oryzae]MBP2704404.1 hypothetical protein [Microbispora oryzae]